MKLLYVISSTTSMLIGYLIYKYRKNELYDVPIIIYKFYRNNIKKLYYKCFNSHIYFYNYTINFNMWTNKFNIDKVKKLAGNLSYTDMDNWFNSNNLNFIEYNIIKNDSKTKYYKQLYAIHDIINYDNSDIMTNWDDYNLFCKEYILSGNIILSNGKKYSLNIKPYCIIGNKIDLFFVIYYLKYNYNYDIDSVTTYEINFMDNNIKQHTINNNNYVLFTDNGIKILDNTKT